MHPHGYGEFSHRGIGIVPTAGWRLYSLRLCGIYPKRGAYCTYQLGADCTYQKAADFTKSGLRTLPTSRDCTTEGNVLPWFGYC